VDYLILLDEEELGVEIQQRQSETEQDNEKKKIDLV